MVNIFNILAFILLLNKCDNNNQQKNDENRKESYTALEQKEKLTILTEIFLKLPDSVVFNLSTKERTDILKCKKPDNESCNRFWINTFDEKNGYLSIKGSFEGSWEMTYWKNSQNEILIGVNYIGCGPVCSNIYAYFYLYKNQKLEYHSFKLPQLKPTDFFNEPTLSVVAKENPSLNVVFRLPKNGTTIVGELEPLAYAQFIDKSKNNRVELIWDGNKDFKTVLKKTKL